MGFKGAVVCCQQGRM